jgi:hypothetical protein
VISAPWWFTILWRFGPNVLLGAAGSRDDYLSGLARLLGLGFTGGLFWFVDVLLLLGIIGLLHSIVQRRPASVIWFMLIAVAMPGAGAVYMTIPFALLIGIGATEVVLPALSQRRRLFEFVGGIACLAVFVNALGVIYEPYAPVDAIPASDRALMASLGQGPPIATLTGRPWWGEGPGEWLPALSSRSNAALGQGAEWLGPERWRELLASHDALQRCAAVSVDCTVAWMRAQGTMELFVSAVVQPGRGGLSRILDDDRLDLITRVGDSALLRLRVP